MDVADDNLLEGDERFWGQLRFPAASTTPSNVVLDPDVASADILDNDGKCPLFFLSGHKFSFWDICCHFVSYYKSDNFLLCGILQIKKKGFKNVVLSPI